MLWASLVQQTTKKVAYIKVIVIKVKQNMNTAIEERFGELGKNMKGMLGGLGERVEGKFGEMVEHMEGKINELVEMVDETLEEVLEKLNKMEPPGNDMAVLPKLYIAA